MTKDSSVRSGGVEALGVARLSRPTWEEDRDRALKRLGKRQIEVLLSLEEGEWGPASCHRTAKRMFYTQCGTSRAIVFHRHRTDNCWSLSRFGLELKIAILKSKGNPNVQG